MALKTSINIDGALKKLNLMNEMILDQLDIMAEQIAGVGIDAARNKLDSSITRSGIKRMQRGIGNSAGRNLTGEMINSLKYLGATRGTNGVKLNIGWEDSSYFKFQEKGTRGKRAIPAAHSLRTARRAMENELPRLEKNMRQRLRRKGLI